MYVQGWEASRESERLMRPGGRRLDPGARSSLRDVTAAKRALESGAYLPLRGSAREARNEKVTLLLGHCSRTLMNGSYANWYWRVTHLA